MRPPDLYIGPKANPQTSRWHLWRRVVGYRAELDTGKTVECAWQLSLHRWHRSDDDRALHDHSGHNISILLTGCYTEVLFDPRADPTRTPVPRSAYPYGYVLKLRLPFIPYFRRAATPHRVVLSHGPIWSLWFRFPPIREWGFWCGNGWKHWKDYCGQRDYSAKGSESTVGKGCG